MSEDTLTLEKFTAMTMSIRREAVFNPGRIIESVHMTDGPFEDWSGVRSPSRARRRRARGHRQNIRYYHVPKPGFVQLPDGTLVGHPATVRALSAKIGEQIQRKSDAVMMGALLGSRP